MDVNSVAEIKDGDETRTLATAAPSPVNKLKPMSFDGNVRKKRRRGKSKRKIMKPFIKMPWPDSKRNDKIKRNNRFRKIVLGKTHAPAPFNNNQFLMEIHKPEPENDFHIGQTPSTRTRDSSFSVDSEENYFYSLPEDEEDFLTKEFSSVYEDAQSERLSNMSKNELIQEYLLLEAKYDTLLKRTERSRSKLAEDGKDNSNISSDKDTSSSPLDISDEPSSTDYLQHFKEQEDQISELKLANEKLILENQLLRQKSQCSSSEDSESDSSSTSISGSSSSQAGSTVNNSINELNNFASLESHNGINGHGNEIFENSDVDYTRVNGHNQNCDPSEEQ